MGGFARDAPKAQNGFILRENCFVRAGATTQFPEMANHFNPVAAGLQAPHRVPPRPAQRHRTPPRHGPALRASHAFYVFLLKEAANEGWVEPGTLWLRPKPSNREPESPDAFS
ncbi:hypothetical protein QRQ56_08495 [Bradyrhizobium sp. U531]|uniref:hypothetical protein n=1 Tax=Bradyrhizobium sp. U531 TaxID=3053458 RepID=UPI003F4230A4